MRLVFLPGDVHIRALQEHSCMKTEIMRFCEAQGYPSIPLAPLLPGFHLLATCKQAYAEGCHMGYHSNTFFLPPGELDETLKHFFEDLQAQLVGIITNLGVTLGLEDLTTAVFKRVQDTMAYSLESLPSSQQGQAWGVAVQAHLADMWRQRIDFLSGTRDLNIVKLGTERGAYESQGRHLNIIFKNRIQDGDDWYPLCVDFLAKNMMWRVRTDIADRVDRDGWRGLRA